MDKKSKSEMRKLEFLIGKWITQGTVLATEDSPAIPIKGTDTYELVSDGFFILHTVSVLMGKDSVNSIEVIGFDDTLQNYSMQSFDNLGTIVSMTGTFDDHNAFLLIGEKQRATLTANVSLTELEAFWEQSKDGKNWAPWMNLTLSK